MRIPTQNSNDSSIAQEIVITLFYLNNKVELKEDEKYKEPLA